MTAPVITSQEIPMAAPVVSDAASMSFVLPAGTKREETPDPLDSRVRIVTLPERDMLPRKTCIRQRHICRTG